MSDEYKAICEKGLNELYSLRAENEELREQIRQGNDRYEGDEGAIKAAVDVAPLRGVVEQQFETMREVAEELRADADENETLGPIQMRALAARLDPPHKEDR